MCGLRHLLAVANLGTRRSARTNRFAAYEAQIAVNQAVRRNRKRGHDRLATHRVDPDSIAIWQKYCAQYGFDRGTRQGQVPDEPLWKAPEESAIYTSKMDPEIPLCWSDVPGSFAWRLAQERKALADTTATQNIHLPWSDFPFADCEIPACAVTSVAKELPVPQASQVTRWNRRRNPGYAADMWREPVPPQPPLRVVASVLTTDPPQWLRLGSHPLNRDRWYRNAPQPDDPEIQPPLLPLNTAPLAWVLVDGKPARALLDTGSIISIISREFWMSLGSPPLWPCRPRAVAVDGDPIAMDGAQRFEFTIGHKTAIFVFYVMPHAVVDCLMGIDLLRFLKSTFCFNSQHPTRS